ncbi:MAG TPA: MFS transporter, partial [Anaerolineae bacterium]
ATLLTTSTLTVMAAATVAPALPAMRQAFQQVSNVDLWVRLVLTLPALFIAASAPFAGIIIDRFGRKRLLAVSALLYGLAGGSGYVLPTLSLILAGRALLGVAVAGIMTSVTTLIADYYEGPARARFLGLQAGFMGLGGTLFLTLGGVLADVGWRNPFLIYAGAFLVLPFILLALNEPAQTNPGRSIAHPVSEPGDCVAEAMWVAAPLNAATTTAVATPIKLLVVVYGLMMLVQITFYLIPVQLPFYLQTLTGATAAQSGLAIAVLSTCYALASMAFGWVNARLDRITVLAIAFALTGGGYATVALAAGWNLLYTGLIASGVGLGLTVPNLNVWLTNETPAALRGRALGGLTTALFLGQFLSPLVSQPIIRMVGIGQTYLLAAGVSLSLVLLLLARRQQLRQLATVDSGLAG